MNQEMLFSYNTGGFGVNSKYYEVFLEDGKYVFRTKECFGASKQIISQNDNIVDANTYNNFVEAFNKISSDWQEKYTDPQYLDGTTWHIDAIFSGKSFMGIVVYPLNFELFLELLKTYFKSE